MTNHPEGVILILSAEPTELAALEGILAISGFATATLHTRDEVSSWVEHNTPLLILANLSVRHPMFDVEFCYALREKPHLKDVPVFVLSDDNDLYTLVHALDAGINDYLVKPAQMEEILARLQIQLRILYQQQQIEALRQQEARHYARLNELRDNLLQSTTHDLKNPLTVIKSTAYLLETLPSVQADDEVRAHIKRIQESADFMQLMIGELLDIARLETELGIHPVLLDLAKFVPQQAEAFRVATEEKHIAFSVQVRSKAVFVNVDMHKFTRVIGNLLSNAIKYTPSGGKIEVWVAQLEDEAEIGVLDTGIGISEADLPRVFDKFYRTNEDTDASGYGLGLAVVQAIVQRHDGNIYVESALGKGSTFVVRVPLYAHFPNSNTDHPHA